MPIAAEYFIGTVNNELVCHIAVCPSFHTGYYRATRLVVMPEWQGAGVGTKFLEWICEYHKRGEGRLNRKLPTMFHTSHPQLIGYLKRSKNWVLKSQGLFGQNKKKSLKSLKKTAKGKSKGSLQGQMKGGSGFGGHFRAVQGFKYVGDRNE